MLNEDGSEVNTVIATFVEKRVDELIEASARQTIVLATVELFKEALKNKELFGFLVARAVNQGVDLPSSKEIDLTYRVCEDFIEDQYYAFE